MKWLWRTIVAWCLLVGLASPSLAGQVRLEIRDGLVTLDAKDATIREILAEWARVGQTLIINAEKVPGGPMTVQLNGVPERQALETLLRSAAGFVAAPRAIPQAFASMYDRIMLMPGSRPTVVPTSAGSSPFSQVQQPSARERYVPPPAIVVDDEDGPLPTAQMPVSGMQPGAPQPGMATTPNAPVPYNGAGMASPNGTPNNPARQGSPNDNPYGTPYGNPYNPNPDVPPGTIAPRTGSPTPQPPTRPGMPTAPVPPIKGAGGEFRDS